jgi:hypothetical protein
MRSRAPTKNNEEQHQHQAHSIEPEHESSTHPQARGLLTKAWIRAPFDGEEISLITRQSNTIDNVKAKISNVKAKIRDEEDWGPRSIPTLARRHDSDQLAAFPTSSPQGGSPRRVSASPDKSPARTTSLSLTR